MNIMRKLCPNCSSKLISIELSQIPPVVQVYCQFCVNPITRKGETAENFDAAAQLLNKNYEQSINTSQSTSGDNDDDANDA